MADIDVERKGPSIWPWILGLLLLLLLGWLLWEWLDDDEEVLTDPATVGVTEPLPPGPVPPVAVAPGQDTLGAALPAPVQQYLTTCTDAQGSMAMDHQYTSNCIQRLTASLDAVLQSPNLQGVDVRSELQDYRQKAQRLVESPEASTQHANMTRDAFTSMATLLNKVQDARYPGLSGQVDQLEQRAQSVQAEQQLLEQRDAVHGFFRQAGDVLQAMATTPAAAS